MRRTKWMMTMLLKSCQPGSDRAAVKVKGYSAVEIGAVDVDAGVLQALQNIRFRQTERRSEADRDHRKARLHGLQDFRCGGRTAAVVAHLQQVCFGMVQARDAALHRLFSVAF